ncbi:MAG: rhamnulokinase, partial [Candidatus Aminicenantes bacterium]
MSRPNDPHHFLALDLGAESGRALLGTLDGGHLSVREIRRFPNTPLSRAGHIHWNVPALLEEVKAAMRDAAALFPRGLAGMGV